MEEPPRRPEISISAIPVAGIGGAGLVVAVSMAVVFPEARWLLTGGLVGGVILAVALVLLRRR